MTIEDEISEVLAGYGIKKASAKVTCLGQGNINDTYLVVAGNRRLVLQRISKDVFPDPKIVVENFFVIHRHLEKILNSLSELSGKLCCATPIRTADGRQLLLDNKGGCWRAQSYIKFAHSPTVVEQLSKAQAISTGSVLATFHHHLSNLNLSLLKNPLPGFHDLPQYLREFDGEVTKITDQVSPSIGRALQYIERYRTLATRLEDALGRGVLHLQPVHGDPKVDNFVYDKNYIARGIIDLDTVGAGLIQHDIGDCLRSSCNRIGESPEELQPPRFDLEICNWILQGYLGSQKELLTEQQADYIFEGVFLITYELGLRFLTDHLRGNTYFKVEKSGDNLQKALVQFGLAEDIAAKEKEIRGLVRSLYRG